MRHVHSIRGYLLSSDALIAMLPTKGSTLMIFGLNFKFYLEKGQIFSFVFFLLFGATLFFVTGSFLCQFLLKFIRLFSYDFFFLSWLKLSFSYLSQVSS